MAQQIPNNAPASQLFPQYPDAIPQMFATEVRGLTDAQLDFTSDRWEWGLWSIRRNTSHVASMAFRWLLGRWGSHDIVQGLPLPDDAQDIISSGDRWLDETRYHSIESMMTKMQQAMDLCQGVLLRETVASLRSKELAWTNSAQSQLMRQAHPGGFSLDPTDDAKVWITLEYTFRHMYYEAVTHLFNIQRLKRAQGLQASVQIPREGYWCLPGWDASEP